MARIVIQTGTDKIIEGEYEYVEGGFEEDGNPGFHISAGPATVYVYFDSKEEYRDFLESLKEQIPLDKE